MPPIARPANSSRLARGALIESGVKFITLLALNDQGAPRYNAALAEELAAPGEFPALMARALS